MKPLVLLLTLIVGVVGFSQNNDCVLSDRLITGIDTSNFNEIINNKSELLKFYKSQLNAKVANTNWNADDKGSLQDRAIIFIHQKEDGTQISSTILHTKGTNKETTWTDQLTEVQNILFVMTGTEDLITATFDIEKLKSSFSIELEAAWEIIPTLVKGTEETAENTTSTFRIVEINPKKINAPSKIHLTHSKGKVSFEIFETSYASVKLGINASQIEKQDFKLENGMLTIDLDDDRKKTLTQNLFIGFAIHPWGRGPNYDPRFSNYQEDSGFLNRIGIWGGCNFSLKPLDDLYAGISYDLFQNFTINGGISWHNRYESSAIEIGTISSLDEALKLSNKHYGVGQLMLGVSFSPSYALKNLNLWKND